MRETFDELWIIDLGGDNLGTRKSENVFAIRTPVAIAIGVRTGDGKLTTPATVRYCGSLVTGSREEKLERLAEIETFDDLEWEDCFSDWEEPLLPEREGNYFSWPLLTDLLPWQHSGIQFKRTWPISVEREVLLRRWKRLVEATAKEQAQLMRSTEAKNPEKQATDLRDSSRKLPPLAELEADTEPLPPQSLAYRSLDRQWMLPDARLIDRPRPPLWSSFGQGQVYLTSMLTKVLGAGPGAIASAEIPDLDYFAGRGAKDVIPLWRDAEGRAANIASAVLPTLEQELGREIAPEDLFAYVYAVLAGEYTSRFAMELEIPGPRIPVSKDAKLFAKAAEFGSRLIWLHTYGERFLPFGEKHGVIPPGSAKCTVGVPGDKEHYPETFEYIEEKKQLRVGDGLFEPVAPEVWQFSVSGLQVVRSWLSYRMKEGAGRRSSPLDDIRPETWPAAFTEELCRLLWIIEQTLELTPTLTTLLEEIIEGPIFTADELPKPTAEERAAPKPQVDDAEQLTLGGTDDSGDD